MVSVPQTKLAIKQVLMKKIEQQESVDLKKFCAIMALNYGWSTKPIYDLIETMKDAGVIEVDQDGYASTPKLSKVPTKN